MSTGLREMKVLPARPTFSQALATTSQASHATAARRSARRNKGGSNLTEYSTPAPELVQVELLPGRRLVVRARDRVLEHRVEGLDPAAARVHPFDVLGDNFEQHQIGLLRPFGKPAAP